MMMPLSGYFPRSARTALALLLVSLAPLACGAPVAAVGQQAPALQWARLEGGNTVLQQLRGRPVLLNYWASWCGPCLKELPDLQRFAKAQSASKSGVQVIGIAQDEADAAAALRDQLQLTYPQLLETDGPPGSAAAFGNRTGTLPFSVLIGADGRILKVHNGLLHPEDLERWAAATH